MVRACAPTIANRPGSSRSVQGVICGVRVEEIEDPLMQQAPPHPRSARHTRSGVKGIWRMRTPTAWWMAEATAGATPSMGISAMALAP
uniref:DUF2200 domain-containing protein n=1 Tax=Litorilinea aerophila TaxID=1204385 RepID=A0A540VMG2_9CHLR